ncbi:MAG: hypothetical protein U0791_06825 [Gemmataceae bacterium]
MNEIQKVALNAREKALFDFICWDIHELARRDDRSEHFDKMRDLAESLIKRKAVPEVRLAIFTDPQMNAGGRGKSRQQVFESNGTTGRDILRHPHFMAHLRYFLNGPDLPRPVIEGFCKVIEDDAGTSGMVLDQIKAFVRKAVRDRRLNPRHAADEFYKLAHEIDRGDLADNVRAAAKSVRT